VQAKNSRTKKHPDLHFLTQVYTVTQKLKPPLSLSQSNDFWYCATRRVRTWIETKKGSEKFVRPWLLIMVHQNSGTLLNLEVLQAEPTFEEMRDRLYKTMRKPAKDSVPAHRPLEIHFEDRALVDGLRPLLAEISVTVRFQPQRKKIDELIEMLQLEMFNDEENIPGLLKQPGVKPELVGRLFEAASFFYHAQPWLNLVNEDILAIRVDRQAEPYYVSVMGNGGQEYGLSVFLNWQEVESFFTARNPEKTLPQQGSHVFLFDSPPMVSFDDLDAIEKYGWQLPAPELYPVPLIFTPDRVLRPKADMLRWYEAVLRALPIFVEHHFRTNPDGSHSSAEASLVVKTSAGNVTVWIRYPAGDLAQVKSWVGLRKPVNALEANEVDLIIPDQRAIEGSLANLTAGMSDISIYSDPKTDEAQQIMYQAWEETNRARRISLAKKALKLSENCADAYVLLAEEAPDRVKALELYQKGIEAGRRALSQAFFEDAENIGHFWGILETRPFMRALEGHATSLWALGQREDALAQYREMIRLNPNDNQGVRYQLLNLLLELEREDDAQALLDIYKGDWSADWAYTEALLAFRKFGRGRQAQIALKHALKVNRHVPAYLTGKKRIPIEPSLYVTMGGEDEAANYAAEHLNFWRKSPGAVAWLEQTT
jgi:tetratricopeptide (TPR) repeat protein